MREQQINCPECRRPAEKSYGHHIFGERRKLWFDKYLLCKRCSFAARCYDGKVGWVPSEDMKKIRVTKVIEPRGPSTW